MKIVLTNDLHSGFSNKTDRIHRYQFLPKLKAEAPDLLCVQGDWAITKPEQAQRLMKILRQGLPHTRILGVLGNHDFWEMRGRYFADIVEELEAFAKSQDIVLLNWGESYKVGGLNIFGFMGWYGQWRGGTNDPSWMADWGKAHEELQERAEKAMVTLEALPSRQDLCLTHFPPFADESQYEGFCAKLSYFDRITTKCRYLFTGHSHRDEDFVHNGCRVLSSGSDYDRPKYKVLEISPEVSDKGI